MDKLISAIIRMPKSASAKQLERNIENSMALYCALRKVQELALLIRPHQGLEEICDQIDSHVARNLHSRLEDILSDELAEKTTRGASHITRAYVVRGGTNVLLDVGMATGRVRHTCLYCSQADLE